MNYYYIPAIIAFLGHAYLFISWWKSRQKKDGKEKMFCFWGFLLGQLYLLWEVFLVKQTGKPLPGSLEQKALMLRLALGASMGGLFTLFGLFYLSFAYYGLSKDVKQKNQ